MTNINSIQRECLEGRISVAEAINQIDTAIGGIARCIFHEGFKFKVINHNEMFPLDFKGIRKKDIDRLYAFVIGLYFKAQENGSIQPGEVHISENASTKHHIDGINRIWNMYKWVN